MSSPLTIDDVVRRLDEIVAWSVDQQSRLGYFAALYRRVTLDVKDQIAAGAFDDGARMARLDVLFAGRYLAAFDAHRSGAPVSASWAVAFNTSRDWWSLVLQHLLVGINAHINLDLGIAAAQTAPGPDIQALKHDFDRINGVLAALVDRTQNALGAVWPMLRVLDWISANDDETIINFNIDVARQEAWSAAVRLAGSDEAAFARTVHVIDRKAALLGTAIHHPGVLLGSLTNVIRLGERGRVSDHIALLQRL